MVLIYILLPWRTSLLFPGKQLFSFGVFLKFSFQILKITRYKIPRFDCKALFINVPNSHNHKGILIALPFLRKVMSIYETWKFQNKSSNKKAKFHTVLIFYLLIALTPTFKNGNGAMFPQKPKTVSPSTQPNPLLQVSTLPGPNYKAFQSLSVQVLTKRVVNIVHNTCCSLNIF